MYLIDTNIHAAYLLQNFEDDDLTGRYLSFFNTIPLSDRLIPDFIIGELETFIIRVVPSRYGLNSEDKQELKQLTFDYIERITTGCTVVVPDVEVVQHAKKIYLANSIARYISFVDSLLIAFAARHNHFLYTKDERLSYVAKQYNVMLPNKDKNLLCI